MTKKERKKLIEAIDHFLDEDPDKWTNGIDVLFLLVYGIKWTEYLGLNNLKSVKIQDLIRLTINLKKTDAS